MEIIREKHGKYQQWWLKCGGCEGCEGILQTFNVFENFIFLTTRIARTRKGFLKTPSLPSQPPHFKIKTAQFAIEYRTPYKAKLHHFWDESGAVEGLNN